MINIPVIPYVYDIFIYLSFLVSFVLIFLQNRKSFKLKILLPYLGIIFLFSLGGGYLMGLYQSLIKNYKAEFTLSSYGGAIGMLVSAWICKFFLGDYGDKLVRDSILTLPLIYGVSKLGCSFVGCCHGFIYNGFGSVHYPKTGGPYFPVQFIEVFLFVLIYIFIYLFNKKHKELAIPVMFIISGTVKAGLDFLRYNSSSFFTVNKIISYLFIILGMGMIIYKYIKGKQNKQIEPA